MPSTAKSTKHKRKGGIKCKTVRFFWNYFKVYKFSFVIVVLMVAVATIAQALFPVFSGQAVTELANLVLAYQNGTSELAWQSLSALMLNLALVVLALVVSSLIYMTLMTRVIAESTNEMRKGLFGKLSRLTVSFFDRHQDGDILSHFTSDLDNILQAFNESLVQVMSNIALYIGLIFVMFSRNEIRTLPDRVFDLFGHMQSTQKMADCGYQAVKEHHTWKSRAEWIREAWM